MSRAALDMLRAWEESFLVRFLWVQRFTRSQSADGKHRTPKQYLRLAWTHHTKDGGQARTADMVWMERSWAFLNRMFDGSWLARTVLLPLLCARSKSQWTQVQAAMAHRFSHEGGWRSIKGRPVTFWDDQWSYILGWTNKEECCRRGCTPAELLGPHTKPVFPRWARRAPKLTQGTLTSWQAVRMTRDVHNMLRQYEKADKSRDPQEPSWTYTWTPHRPRVSAGSANFWPRPSGRHGRLIPQNGGQTPMQPQVRDAPFAA